MLIRLFDIGYVNRGVRRTICRSGCSTMYVLWIGLLDILYVDQVDRRAAYVIRVLMLDILSVDHGGRHIIC